eukprot:CAMPEP_0172839864 /NCGR_PEP_ID=MMETSP1075-20121228/28878_1 /TAXON_ID=2916 /ORGANISM="Ceratium fusus, Strain PA161109" /LENGTH=150 /DNA_ID=CAMNT_0013683585 /DNA_START=39 /DNA_END=488 /DNA_ORIENTATION=+
METSTQSVKPNGSSETIHSSDSVKFVIERGMQTDCFRSLHEAWIGAKELVFFASLGELDGISDRQQEGWSQTRKRVAKMIGSHFFSCLITAVVIASVAIVIIDADRRAKCAEGIECVGFSDLRLLDGIFLGIYTIEIVLRLYVYQMYFFS